jgi:hypothetical protein
MTILQDLRTWRFWGHFLTRSFASVGAIVTLLHLFHLVFPHTTAFEGLGTLISVIVISVIAGLIWSWPRPITQDYSTPKTRISVVKGNLLDEKTHLVIGTCDTFDTETPIIISKGSLQGQALDVLFGGDLKELDRLLADSLTAKGPIGSITKAGKQVKYGIGTVAPIKQGSRLIFFLAYTEMDERNVAGSTADGVWKSLLGLWKEISNRANGAAVSMPVIGGGQARLSSLLPAQDSIRLVALSFMVASRERKVCDELRIVVKPEDYKALDRLELQSFLSSLRAS